MTPRRRLAAVLATVLAVGAGPALAGAVPAQAAPTYRAPGQATLNDVLSDLHVENLGSDYVVLVDTSSSMQQGVDLYARARSALTPMLNALDPADRLTLVSFDVTPSTHLYRTTGRRADALGALPTTARGAGTDIGASIEVALDALDVPGVTDPAVVILMTDGKLEPPARSPYSAGSPAWQTLADRGKALLARRSVRAYAVPLAENTDAALLASVFPGRTQQMNLPPDQVERYLATVRDQMKVRKAAGYVSLETLGMTASAPPETRIPAAGGDITVTLTSLTSRVPLTFQQVNVAVNGLPVDATLERGEVAVPPGGTATLRVRIAPHPERGLHLGEQQVVRTGGITVAGKVGSPWSDVLVKEFALPFDPQSPPVRSGVRVTTVRGLSLWYVTGPLALICGLALLVWRRRRARWHALRGTLVIDEHDGAQGYEVHLGRRKVRFPSQRDGSQSSAGLLGRGEVRGRWVRSDYEDEAEQLELHVRYIRDGKSDTGIVRAGEPGSVQWAEFTYRED